VLVVFLLGLFMTLLDLTIVNVALPSMAAGLGTSLDQVLWVLNAYSIAYAVLLVTAGRLGDIVGPRTMFVAGMTVFTLASAGSGAAPTVSWLIVARAVQGLGAAMLAPQGLPLFTSVLPPERRGGACWPVPPSAASSSPMPAGAGSSTSTSRWACSPSSWRSC
jgi:MFS family permease